MLRRTVVLVQALTAVIAAAGVVMLLVAQPPPPPPMPVRAPGSTIDLVAAGRPIYASQCESCHGAWGEGVYAPVTIDAAASKAKFPDPEVEEAVVLDGRGQMPSFRGRLTADQVEAVVAYVRTLS